jgi:hypothetical protein
MTTNPSVTRDELFFLLDDFTGASTQSIEQLKKLLDLTVFKTTKSPPGRTS